MMDNKEGTKRSALDHGAILYWHWKQSREGENAAVIANKVQICLTTWNTIYLTDI